MDILISRQKDPNIREYQEKAIAEKRFQDTAFKLGVGPRGQSAYSITDPYMPKITDIQKQYKIEPNQIQAAVVKEIDTWNQTNRIRNRRNEFRGPMPSPKRLLGDKYDETKRYEWQNTGKHIASILDLSDKQMEKFKDEDQTVYKKGSYAAGQDRIEWREPITRDDRMTIAHEQLHRFIQKHPSGKAFRNLDGDHELFVRAYTHLLDGGRLDDPELMVDLESAVGKYSDINLNRFLKDVPRKSQAFERAVLGADYGEPIKRENWLREIVVTAARPKTVDDQMEQLLSPNKKETIVDDLKVGGFKRPEVLAGLLGNIGVETGYTYDHLEKGANNAHGLFGLDFMKPYYDTYLEENNKTDSSVSQIEFVYSTIYGDNQNIIGAGNAKKLRKVFEEGTAEEIAQSFMEIWERPGIPHLDRRIKTTTEWLDILNK